MDKVASAPTPPVPPVLNVNDISTPTPTMNISAAWVPMATPSLKLPTPVLDSAAWGEMGGTTPGNNGNNGSGAGGLLSAGPGGPGGLGSGMSPRFMLDNLRMSPGVSGSIAPNADVPKTASSSLAELFIVNEYSNPPAVNNGGSGNSKVSMAMPVSMPMSNALPSGLAVNVSQAQSQAQLQVHHQQQQQQAGLPPKQPMPPLPTTVPVSVSAPQDTTNMPVHSAAGALRTMQRPVLAPQQQQQHMVPPSNSAIPHPQQVAYTHARSLPMSHIQPHQQAHPQGPPAMQHQQAQAPADYQQARYPAMGYPTAMPPTHANAPMAHPARMGMPHANTHGHTQAHRQPVRVAAPATRGANGGAVSSAIEEAKQNAQERADKFAQKRKRTRAANGNANANGNSNNASGGSEGDERDDSRAGSDLKKKRYNRRLELNRQSAAVSRVRRRAYVEELEGKLMYVEREKLNLEDQVTVMTNENGKLRQQVRHLHEQLSNSTRANNNNGGNNGGK